MVASPATYEIFVRNSSLQYVGEIDYYDKLTYKKAYNAVGSFVLQLDVSHPMASYLATPGYGITVLRNGAVDFSGPVRYVERKGGSTKTLIVKGADDMVWLQDRQAYPVTNYPYAGEAGTAGPLRLYPLSEVSGTTAFDSTISPQNGTYHGSYTQGQPPIIDDIIPSLTLSGGYISVPTTGLPTGNSQYNMAIWFILDSYPAATAVLCQLGTIATSQQAYMGLLSSGAPTMQLLGVNYSATTAVSLHEPHCLQLRWDGTTATLLVDGSAVSTQTPGAQNITYGTATIGALSSGANPFNTGRIQFAQIGGNLAGLPSNTLNPWLNLPYLGASRFASLPNPQTAINAWDTQSGAAETVAKHFVNYNLGPSATSDRQLSNFSVEADAGQGSTVYADANFQQLLQPDGNGLLQVIARNGGIGIRMVQVSGALQFQCFLPNDKTSNALFSEGLGNLGDYDYSVDATQLINYVFAAAGNSTPPTACVVYQDAASQVNWGRIEGFLQSGSTTDYLKLLQLATNASTQSAGTTLSAVLLETDGLQYGRDFNLGDKVTVVIDNTTLQDIVREVQIDLDPSTGETVTPAIGTPGRGQIMAALRHFSRQLAQQNTRLSTLERAP